MDYGSRSKDFGKHKVNWYTIVSIAYACFGSMSYAASAAVISTTLGQPSFYRYMGLSEGGRYYNNADALIGAANSLFYAGGIIGPFLHGWIADAYGRKASILGGCTIVLVAQALITGSAHIGMFIACRFLGGMGAFFACSAVPTYIVEICPPRDRGKLSEMHAIAINISYTITGYIGVGFFFFDSDDAFRGPLALTMLPPILIVIGIWFLPESPRWLLSKNRTSEAWAVVNRLHGDPNDQSNEFAKREYYQMCKQVELDQSLPSGYKEIWTRPSYRKRALIAITLLVCVMSSGVLVVQNYGVIIFACLGYDNLDTLLLQSGYTAGALFWSIVAIAIVDRIPRNQILGIGYAMCGMAIALLTILLSRFEDSTNESGLSSCVAMVFFYSFCFEMFLVGPHFFYQGEIWPSHLRAQGYATAMWAYSAINIPWLQAAPTAFATIGYYYYIFFICFSAFGSLMAFFVFPNTLHKPLEEVAALFGDADLVAVYQTQLHDGKGFEKFEEIESTLPAGKGVGGQGEKQVTLSNV